MKQITWSKRISGRIFAVTAGVALLVGFIFNFLPQAQALSVASGDGLLVYGLSGNTTPQWRTYTNASNAFGTAAGTVAGTTGLNFITRTSPTKQEAISGYTNAAGSLQIMCYDGTSWTNDWSVSVGGTGTTRRFDIAYETNSGDVIVLYSRNVSTTNELAYRTKAGGTGCGAANWSSEILLDSIGSTGVVQWVKLAWDKRAASNLITGIWADSNADLGAGVWSGSAWGDQNALETSLEFATAAQDVDDFDVEYESLSGDVMIAWANSVGANGTNGVRYKTCVGGTATCTWSGVLTPPTFADDATNLDISGNPNTDEIVFASIGNAGSDLQAGYWSGSAWTNQANSDTSAATPVAGTHLVATGWLVSGGTTRSIVVYNDSATTGINWVTGVGGTFTIQTDFAPTPAFGNPQRWYEIGADPINKDRLMFTLADTSANLFAKRLVMTSAPAFTWTNADGGASLGTLAQALRGDFSFAYWRFIPPILIVTTGSTGTQVINMSIPSLNNYVGGAFTLVRNSGSTNVTQITVSETGTVNATVNLSNVDLYYEITASCVYDGTETLFGTAASFNASQKATVSGVMAVGTSQVCVYAVLDVGAGASAGQTIELEITNPSTEITVSAGTVAPSSAVLLAGTTTLLVPVATFNQSGYRFFENDNGTTVTTALALQDTPASLVNINQAFRVRLLLHVGSSQLSLNGANFKLQYATRSGTCDTGFAGESYVDVTGVTLIAYNDNSTPIDGASLTVNGSLDPNHSGHTTVAESYEEQNNFTNSVSAIPAGQDGMWDFALKRNGAPSRATYCLRVVKSDGTLVDTYSVIPQITVSPSYISSGTYVSSAFDTGAARPFHIIAWTMSKTNAACGSCVIRVQIKTSPDGVTWSPTWAGPDGELDGDETDYYTVSTGQLIHTDHNGDRWIRYRTTFDGDTNASPVLEEIKINYRN